MNVRYSGNVRHTAWTHKDDNAALLKTHRKPEVRNSAKAHVVAIETCFNYQREQEKVQVEVKKKETS